VLYHLGLMPAKRRIAENLVEDRERIVIFHALI
jgi:hypothetical protein